MWRRTEHVGGIAGPVGDIHHAAFYGKAMLIDYWLERGVNPDVPGPDAYPPLLHAARGKRAECVQRLLGGGANPNVSDAYSGRTALMIAAASGRLATVQQLLRYGAEVDRVDNAGATALVYAIRAERWRIVTLLSSVGASMSVRTLDGLTIWEQCSSRPKLRLNVPLWPFGAAFIWINGKPSQVALAAALQDGLRQRALDMSRR